MAATTNFSYLLLIALTSSVIAGPDDTSSVPSIPEQKRLLQPSSSIEHSSNDKNVSKSYRIAEGGLTIFPTNQHTEGAEAIYNKSDESKPKENISKGRNAKPSVVARKGVQDKPDKIKPRKGVDQEPERTNDLLVNQTTKEDMKPVAETSSVINTHASTKTSINIPKLNTNSNQSTNLNNSSVNSTNSYHSNTSLTANVTMSHAEVANNVTILKSSTEKHIPKPKPTVTTVDGPEVNESRPLSRTKSSPLGMPRKIDYIVPVIITMVALPILGAALFVLYRRGRDCWDKRHYRRMDFLIDGMYND